MTRNFVLAFGGSGARCAEAILYLCAARCIREPMHVLVIDPDHSNGNVKDALDQLQRYRAVRDALSAESTPSFFSTPLNEGVQDGSFAWQYPNKAVPFESLIDFGVQSAEHRALLSLLYDEGDLKMTFEQGYVGRAHVGSLDMFRTLRGTLEEIAKQEHVEREAARNPGARGRPGDATAATANAALRDFVRGLTNAAQAGQGGANLIVLGSIFGGTGASGIPAFPPLLGAALRDYVPNIRLGCVQLAPYFLFGPPASPGDPDPVLHPIATQAALYHYASAETGYSRFYLVGAPRREATNKGNWPGGAHQRNAAHYVELAAALAVSHFFSASDKASGPGAVAACGAPRVTWDSLPRPAQLRLQHEMAAFTTFCLLHARFLQPDLAGERHRDAKWAIDLWRRTGAPLSAQDEAVQRLSDFTERFLVWAKQLQDSVGEGDLFHIPDGDDAGALAGLVPGGTADGNPYHALVAALSRARVEAQSRPAGWYVEALSRAVGEFCEKNYSWWRA